MDQLCCYVDMYTTYELSVVKRLELLLHMGVDITMLCSCFPQCTALDRGCVGAGVAQCAA